MSAPYDAELDAAAEHAQRHLPAALPPGELLAALRSGRRWRVLTGRPALHGPELEAEAARLARILAEHAARRATAPVGGPPPEVAQSAPPRREAHTRQAPDRAEWLVHVGEQTAEHREQRAQRYEEMAADPDRCLGMYDDEIERYRKWCQGRADGQRERIQRVLGCGTDKMLVTTCEACGQVHEQPLGCSSKLLCYDCRCRSNARTVARFRRARAAHLQCAMRAGWMHRRMCALRLSEKLMTLTVPHSAPSVAARCELLSRAWPYFLRAFNRHVKKSGAQGVVWYRRYEWTVGSDGYGHPHLHVYLVAPYLDQDMLTEWWRAALAKAGYQFGEDEEIAFVHIEKCEGSTVSKEVIKYLVKDIDAKGELVDPVVYAQVYAWLDVVRVGQGSRGFIGLADRGRDRRCDCGAIGSLTCEIRPHQSMGDEQSAPEEHRTVACARRKRPRGPP